MIAFALATPLVFALLIIALASLEEHVVAPVDRAVRINRLIERAPAEEIERTVASMLAPLAPHPTGQRRTA